ncbi:hypothetical protein B296_00048592 [Ensete ventricosum]|uniref:Myb/SANT-like DNA-binding domain-containing protein n=1 Tax=Ensete ventricosum TaxID=4639 RepID=A0A426WY98_ENSVE|nr:hypothetical protein B296_00048592 [Ensete ventricosum]
MAQLRPSPPPTEPLPSQNRLRTSPPETGGTHNSKEDVEAVPIGGSDTTRGCSWFPFGRSGKGKSRSHPGRHAQYVPPFGHVRSEEEPRYGEDVDEQGRRGGVPSQPSSSASPWHRMKWTDGMVRLLIQVVYHVGDDGGGAEGEQQQPHGTVAKGKKSATASAPVSALLQKKGKWKSVSQAMMEKGFYVSPQQCEDKFNDLNKRYKRVNDLLGKGTACRVVENQALLDTMDLSSKAKEEARKLLNSKHLFFREMCAYHNAGVSSTCAAAPSPQIPPPAPSDQQQLCFHHPPGLVDMVLSRTKVAIGRRGGGAAAEDEGNAEEVDDDDDADSEDDDDYDDDDGDEDDDDMENQNHKRHGDHHHQHEEVEEDEDEASKGFVSGVAGGRKHKRTASQMSASPPLSLTLSSPSSSMRQLQSELMAMSGGGEFQQRQWLKRKAAELEEQRVAYQCRAFQLERQHFKWLRFSTNKERDMERMKLDNERLCLENDRMLLLLRQKEIELTHGGTAAIPSAEQQLILQNTNTNQRRPAEQPHIPNADHASTTA